MIPADRRRRTNVFPREARAEVVLLREGVEVASWALVATGRPDLSLVNELARLQLTARRLGCSIWLRRACPAASEIVELAGLGDVLIGGARRPLQVGGEAEGGEQGGVEEVVMPDDPVA